MPDFTQEDLTGGILANLLEANAGENDLWTSGPVLQVLSIKKVASNNPKASGSSIDRYRIIVSDGLYFTHAMLATQLNHLVEDESITKHTIAKIDQLTCNSVQNKRLIILLSLTIIGQTSFKIGEPEAINIDSGRSNGMGQEQSVPAAPTAFQAPARPHQQQQQAQRPTAQGGQNARSRPVNPIESLSPYGNKWTIKVRVTQKSDIRQWSNARGEGKLFNVTLIDESGEIRATGFNQQVDDFYDKLEEGKVYYISKARVNLAKKKFSNLSNEYELSLDKQTEIEECTDQANAPMIRYNFTPLSQLEQVSTDSTCDVIGVVKEIGELGEITSKTTSRIIPKRELVIVDRSSFSVRLTLWGKQAQQFTAVDQPVIAFKGVKVGDFGGRSLSMTGASAMDINPDITEAHSLRGWFDATGHSEQFQAHSNKMSSGGGAGGSFNRSEIRTLADVKDSQLGMSDSQDFFSARATVVHIKSDNIAYPACPKDGCNKKVIEGGEGWRCEKCDMSYTAPEYRYIMSMSVADYTSQAWLQGFNEVGLAVFGMPANQLVDLRNRDESTFNAVLQKATCNAFNFSCRAKQDTYNDNMRVRYSITKIVPLDYRAEAQAMRDLMHSDWAR